MHTISVLKIMAFSNLTISALSLHLPAILFSLSAVSVDAWCGSEKLRCLVSWSVWWRAWVSLEMIAGTSYFTWEIKAEIQKPWNMRTKALSVAFITFLELMFYLCFYYISLPDYPGSFFCLIPIPWCHIKHPCGIHLSPQGFVPGFSLALALFLLLCSSMGFLFAWFGQWGPEMTGMAFLLSLLVPRAAIMSSSQEEIYSKESPDQSPEEASPRSPKMEQDQGR